MYANTPIGGFADCIIDIGYHKLPIGENSAEILQKSTLSELSSLHDQYRYLYSYRRFRKMIGRFIQKKLTDNAKNKLREFSYFLSDIHNMKLYCSPGQYGIGLSIIDHKFTNNVFIEYTNCDVYFGIYQLRFNDLDQLFNGPANVLNWKIQLLQDYAENICRYLIAKALIHLMEHFSWDMSNMIIDYLA